MPGLGAFPLGGGPFGLGTPPEPPFPVTTVISCRLVDGVARDYVTDENGNPVPEDGTQNRVYLLLSYAITRPQIISAQALTQQANDIRAALQPLLSGAAPAIADLAITMTDSGGSEVYGQISYTNLATQEIETLDLV